MKAKGKNNVYCKYGKIAHMFHLVVRPHELECQLYPHCDRKQAVTIGYFNTDTNEWMPKGRDYEWSWPKRMIVAVLYHNFKVASNFYRLIYNKLTIEYIGQQEVLKDG